MTHCFRFALFCALSAGLLPAADAAPVQTLVPADSFIVTHVGTVAQLHRQIALDPVVRRRLARHFHTSAPAVTHYIQDNLVLTTLKKPGRYGVYCVGRSGQEYKITEHLAAGTPVFVLRSTGQPVLKLACGNPMVAALPPVRTKAGPSHFLAASPAKPLRAAPVVTPPLSSSGPVVVALARTPAVVVMPITKVAGFIGQLPAVHGGGGGFPFGYLAGIPLLAVLGSHGGGSNHSPSTGTTGTTGTGTMGTGTTGTGTTGTGTLGTTGTGTNGNTTSGTTGTTGGTDTLGTSTGSTGLAPVPEPGTPAAFAVGGAALLYLLGSAAPRRRKAR